MSEKVRVRLTPDSFATMTVGGVPIEFACVLHDPTGCELEIRTAKKIAALRVLRELPGMAVQPPAPPKAAKPAAPAAKMADVKLAENTKPIGTEPIGKRLTG